MDELGRWVVEGRKQPGRSGETRRSLQSLAQCLPQERPSVPFEYRRSSSPANWWRRGARVMPLTQNDNFAALVRQLGPQIRAVRVEAEKLRQTPPALADALAEAGLYQMYLPRSVGGPEMSPLT